MTGQTNVQNSLSIPAEGFMKALSSDTWVQFYSTGINVTSINYHLEFSLDGTHVATALNGTALTTGSFLSGNNVCLNFATKPEMMWRIRLDCTATGTVNYLIF